jgi:pyrroline-5-carboxylate reductase
MLKGKKIGVIGGGKMGGVLIQGIVTHQLTAKEAVAVSDKDKVRLNELRGQFGIKTTDDNRTAVRGADIVLLAVKPQMMSEVLDEIKEDIGGKQIVISIAAGISIDFMAQRLRKGVRLIRAMPNTPALCGEGATALALGAGVSERDLALARMIFDAVGLTVVVKEDLMNAVTGLSGSGPAYGFIIIEALSDAGVLMGLPRELALKLAAQTLLGAAKLYLSGDKHPGELKDMVTSPAGTTIAGVQALEEGALRATLIAAVEAATLRAGELGKSK